MPHVVAGRCAACRYTYCVVECPVSCFWEIQQPHHMLVIDPGTCIDCEACVPACPINAIWPDHELPAEYQEWTAFNAEHFASGVNVTEQKEPLPTAKLLDEIQAEEKGKGWSITEPSKASA
jgi:ferredoxin